MKVIIAGGRKFKPTQKDWDLLDELDSKFHFTEVVSGKASGVDTFGEEWANSFDIPIPIKHFPAEWDNLEAKPCVVRTNSRGKLYNVLAGFNRNEAMAKYGDAVVLFCGGNGTADMLKRSIEHGLKILYNEKEGNK